MFASFKTGQDPRDYEDNPGKLSWEHIDYNACVCQVVVLFLQMAEMYAF